MPQYKPKPGLSLNVRQEGIGGPHKIVLEGKDISHGVQALSIDSRVGDITHATLEIIVRDFKPSPDENSLEWLNEKLREMTEAFKGQVE